MCHDGSCSAHSRDSSQYSAGVPSPLDAAPPTPDSTGAPPTAAAAAQQPSAKDVIRQRILDKQRANKDASGATNQSAAKPRARSSKKDKDGGGGEEEAVAGETLSEVDKYYYLTQIEVSLS